MKDGTPEPTWEKDTEADIYSTMAEMLIGFCTRVLWENGRRNINCGRDGMQIRRLYLNLCCLQENRFSSRTKNTWTLFKCVA